MKRLLCFVGVHRFNKTLGAWGNLEVQECERCKTHLNINHSMQQAFVSKKHSMLKDIEWSNKYLGNDRVKK